ncbi:MAG: lipoyl(octanoyl) transferase LipB [Proteobacteria bacterium]|nr:lipoyl(octanoyl) transferase LipB [Pseudomonadota bacterium]
MSHPVQLRVLEGLTPYDQGLALQRDILQQRQRDACPDTLLLLEHPPVITLGVSAPDSAIVASREALAQQGIAVHQTERGGQATWHGPGQIVGYPILNLHHRKMGVARYIATLEDMMLRASDLLGVPAMRRTGLTGVYASAPPHGKIGAIGVRVSLGVTWHGFAFNACPDLSHYRLIVPCGASDIPVTSVQQQRSQPVDVATARSAVVDAFAETFRVTFASRDIA